MNTILIIFAAISGAAILKAFFTVLGVAVICTLLWWLLDYLALKEPFNKFLRGLIAVGAVFFLIDVILKLVGHAGYINW